MISDLIYVIEDEPSSVEALSLLLRRAGYQVMSMPDNQAAREAFERHIPDLVIFDSLSNLPEVEMLITWIHTQTNIPIMFCLSQTTEDSISGLDIGEEYLLKKPFLAPALLDRVNSLLSRNPGSLHWPLDSAIEFSGIRINASTRQASVDGKEIRLTTKEFALLWYLAQHPGQVFSRHELLSHVWGHSEYIDPGTITVHIHRLRLKIEVDPANPRHLQSVQGLGYKLEP